MSAQQNGVGQIFSISRYGNNSVAPAVANENTVEGRSRTALLRKRIEHDRKFTLMLFVICVILAIVVIAMACSYVITRNKSGRPVRICESEECIRSAANLRLAMDTLVDPCDDFYKFTCGRWTAEHPDHGWFSQNSAFAIIEEKITFAALKFFQSNVSDKEPLPVRQSRDMYKACMDTEAMDKLGYAPIFKYLSLMGLPSVPTFLNLSSENVDFDAYKFDWLKTEAYMTKLLDLQLFLGFTVEPNIFNTSQNAIVMGLPTLQSPLPSPLKRNKKDNQFIKFGKISKNAESEEDDDDDDDDDDEDEELLSAYKRFMGYVIKTLVQVNYTDLPEDIDERINLSIDVLIKMQIGFIEMRPENETNTDFYAGFKAKDLQNVTNTLLKSLSLDQTDIWIPYLNYVFGDVNVKLDLDGRDLIYIDPQHLQYLFMVIGFLSGMPDVIIELWVWWMAVNALIINTTSDIREYLDKISTPFRNILLRSRAVNCAVLVNDFLGMAVSYAIADKEFLNDTKPKIQQLLGDIKDAFSMRVNAIKWMDEATKEATLDKSNEMISFIGFPEWLMQEGALENYYSNVTINAETHLENMMGIVKLYMEGVLESLHEFNDRNWHSDPTTVNAYNFFLDNSITVPMAILFFPLYNLGLEVLNYGAIGSILGHELTHGFDNTGRKYDKYGNYRQWWSNSTIDKFENLTKCFVKEYGEFYVSEVESSIDGQLTLGENIADNGGLHHAYLAYKNFRKRNGPEKTLPGFEHFTPEQLFFVAFGSIWCDETNVNVLSYQVQDEHCPNKYRVMGTLMNSEEFAEAFRCPKGSKMNPNKEKCRIW